MAKLFHAKRRKLRKDLLQDSGTISWSIPEPTLWRLLALNRWPSLLLFVLFTVVTYFTCFQGQSPTGVQILPNRIAPTKIVAEFPFSYISEIQTELDKRNYIEMVAPVYQLDFTAYNNFLKKIKALEAAMPTLAETVDKQKDPDRLQTISTFVNKFEADELLFINPEDIKTLLDQTDDKQRRHIFSESLIYLHDIFRSGILTEAQSSMLAPSDTPLSYSVHIGGKQRNVSAQTIESAMFSLRRFFRILEVNPDTLEALFRIFQTGLVPNLKYDEQQTAAKKQELITNVKPVRVHVAEGQTIIESGQPVSPLAYEQWNAYRKAVHEQIQDQHFIAPFTIKHWLFTIAILFIGVLYLKLGLPKIRNNKRHLALCVLAFYTNLLIIKLLLELGNTNIVTSNSDFIALIPYLTPVAIAPIIITIMIHPPAALLVALLVSSFNAVLQGSSWEVFCTSLLVCFVGIYFSRGVRLRTRVMRAAIFVGIATMLCAAASGVINEVNPYLVGKQMLTGLIASLVSGIITISVLPMLEKLFHYTTDITLLELTDYNHPLLRKMQMVAPGTYHHSLMVASLAERAAAEVGANPLICRTCALFHDIGKMIKPEYFTENQQGGLNPHTEHNPSMSALVIKSHVKEGVELAQEAKLPQLLIDVIQQHHGTSLIQYFYAKAKALRQQSRQSHDENQSGTATTPVDESIYRYDGPKPQFKECAIIHFADKIEAASRSLAKTTPQSIEGFIDITVQDSLEDHQLDECPLTLQEISKIKRSFSRTLINMLHTRIEYPKKDNAANGKISNK